MAVCNLASIALPSFVAEEGYDFQKLYEASGQAGEVEHLFTNLNSSQ